MYHFALIKSLNKNRKKKMFSESMCMVYFAVVIWVVTQRFSPVSLREETREHDAMSL